MSDAADGGFEFARVPELDSVVAAASDHCTAVGADVEASGPGNPLMGIPDLGGWSAVGSLSIPHHETSVQSSCN